ncbi:MAG: hypothetical protein H6581_17490 [Bacteroidia bacterium]|nr:hypothetical protein [Bacteroidia bacterium]
MLAIAGCSPSSPPVRDYAVSLNRQPLPEPGDGPWATLKKEDFIYLHLSEAFRQKYPAEKYSITRVNIWMGQGPNRKLLGKKSSTGFAYDPETEIEMGLFWPTHDQPEELWLEIEGIQIFNGQDQPTEASLLPSSKTIQFILE